VIGEILTVIVIFGGWWLLFSGNACDVRRVRFRKR
jgi:hypothetical protein